jgi:phosphomannomutase
LAPTAGAALSPTISPFANVRKVACAIARYVVRAEKPSAGVLVGYDTRFGSGERFARAAAEVVSMTGIPVWLAEKACPAPASFRYWCGSAARPAAS